MGTRNKSDLERAIAGLVEDAVRLIEARQGEGKFERPERARGKAHRLSPTEAQRALLAFIRRHDARGIPFAETLGMDWRYLGGLFNRGLVEWRGGKLYAR